MAIVPDFYKFLLEKKEKENEQTSIPDGYEKKKISELKFTDSFDVFNDMDIDDVIKKINLYSSNDIRDSKNRPVKYFILKKDGDSSSIILPSGVSINSFNPNKEIIVKDLFSKSNEDECREIFKKLPPSLVKYLINDFDEKIGSKRWGDKLIMFRNDNKFHISKKQENKKQSKAEREAAIKSHTIQKLKDSIDYDSFLECYIIPDESDSQKDITIPLFVRKKDKSKDGETKVRCIITDGIEVILGYCSFIQSGRNYKIDTVQWYKDGDSVEFSFDDMANSIDFDNIVRKENTLQLLKDIDQNYFENVEDNDDSIKSEVKGYVSQLSQECKENENYTEDAKVKLCDICKALDLDIDIINRQIVDYKAYIPKGHNEDPSDDSREIIRTYKKKDGDPNAVYGSDPEYVSTTNAFRTIAMQLYMNNIQESQLDTTNGYFTIQVFAGQSYGGINPMDIHDDSRAASYGNVGSSDKIDITEEDLNKLYSKIDITEEDLSRIKEDEQLYETSNTVFTNIDDAFKSATGILKLFNKKAKDIGYYAKIVSTSRGGGKSDILTTGRKGAEHFVSFDVADYDENDNPIYNSPDKQQKVINDIRTYLPFMINFTFGKITEAYLPKILTSKSEDEFNKVFNKYVEQLSSFKDEIGDDINGGEFLDEYSEYLRNTNKKADLKHSPQSFYVVSELSFDPNFYKSSTTQKSMINAANKNQIQTFIKVYKDSVKLAYNDLKTALSKEMPEE